MLLMSFEVDGKTSFAYANSDGSAMRDGSPSFVFNVQTFGAWTYDPTERKIFYHVVFTIPHLKI